METQMENTQTYKRTGLRVLGELVLVFLPVLGLLKASASWVGEDPMRGFIIAWVANIYMLAMIALGMKLRKKSWKEIGLTFPVFRLKNVLKTLGWSVVVFIVGVLPWLTAPMILSGLIEEQAAADFSGYEFLRGNPLALLLTLLGVYFISSFAEEVIYRGFLINRISELAANTGIKTVIAILVSSVFFGLIHYQWGAMGMIQTGFFGLAMGICYVLLRKKLWVLILAHAYMDTLLLVSLYQAGS